MADEHYGVIDGSKTYTHHAVARILGVSDTAGRCSKFILNSLLREGLPFKKIGRFYFINGQTFNLWIQGSSATWEAWQGKKENPADDEHDATPGARRKVGRAAR